MSERELYLFDFYNGRSGMIDGLFIATPEEVEAAYGKTVYLGEVLGKHSEIYGPLDPEDVTIQKVARSTVEDLFVVFGATISGYNPLEHIEDLED